MEEARAEARKEKKDAPDLSAKEKEVDDLREKETKIIADYSSQQPVVSQIVDLALLQSGMLKGENMTEFIHRSVKLL